MKPGFGQKGSPLLYYKEYIILAAMLFGYMAFSIGSVYGFSIFPDEFAYWSYAAGSCGYDWSDITSLAPYYSYGYSAVLIPVFALCKDAVTAYRVAVSINFLFLFLAYAALAGTMEKMASGDKLPIALFSTFTVLVPCNLFYAQMTLTETLLVGLYIAAGSILLRYLENNRLSSLVLLMLTLMYLYIVHMRTVGVLLSGIVVLLLHILVRKDKGWHILVIIGMLLPLFAVADSIKQQAVLSVYGGMGGELASGNDYGGQIAKIHYIFTYKGFYDLIVNLLGKILYLGLATYGLFYWGVYALVKQVLKMLQNRDKPAKITPWQQFALFILLSIAAQIIISSVYLLTLGEISDYTYGRYVEMVIPFAMAAGIVTLWKEKARTIWLVTGAAAVFQLLVTVMVARQIANTGAESFQGYFMVGISYLYDGNDFQAGSFYAGAYVLCELLTLLIAAAVLFARSNRKRRYAITALTVLELVLAVRAEQIYIKPFKDAAFRDSRMADKLTAMCEGGRQVIYMDGCFPPYIGILQFMARDVDIRIMERRACAGDYEGDITADDIVVFAYDDAFLQEWTDKYAHEDTYGHFTYLYNY